MRRCGQKIKPSTIRNMAQETPAPTRRTGVASHAHVDLMFACRHIQFDCAVGRRHSMLHDFAVHPRLPAGEVEEVNAHHARLVHPHNAAAARTAALLAEHFARPFDNG